MKQGSVAVLLTNANVAMLNGIAGSRDGYGLMPGTALALEHGHIAWIGPQTDIPSQYNGKPYDCSGRLVTAAPLDCHTHVVHGGNRAGEFEMRLRGASYEEVARAGGGIVSTVKATRAANLDQLVASTLPRVDAMLAEGVSTIEIKSGYGLDRETERDMLRAARRIGEVRPVRICTTFLGAHAVPAEYAGRADAYIDEVCLPALDAAHAEGLVDAVDGFCEGIAFTPQQIGRVFDHADGLGLPVKLHAEQLSDLGGAVMAARRGAQSADHVEYAGPEAAAAMAKSGTVAVLLPGAFYTLHETKKPPVEAFREHGVPMALATDCNPGSSPMSSILLAMNMGCTLFGLTPEEALRGVTVNAARALGLSDTGRVEVGCRADLAVWDVAHPAELAYRIGFNPLDIRIFEGNIT